MPAWLLPAAIFGSALVGGASSVIGGNKQAGAIREGSEASIAEQRRQFDIAQQLTAPQRYAENQARSQLMNILGLGGGGFVEYPGSPSPSADTFDGRGFVGGVVSRVANRGRDSNQSGADAGFSMGGNPVNMLDLKIPGQDFAIGEGSRAVERSAAARGGLASGNTLAALQDRAQGIASQNFLSHYMRPLMGLAGGNAGQFAAQDAMNLGVNIGNTQMGAATNRANIIGNQFAGANQAFQGGLSNYLLMDQMKNNPGSLSTLNMMSN